MIQEIRIGTGNGIGIERRPHPERTNGLRERKQLRFAIASHTLIGSDGMRFRNEEPIPRENVRVRGETSTPFIPTPPNFHSHQQLVNPALLIKEKPNAYVRYVSHKSA
jgi:hypothetical protein